jgi:hypothetical protein
MARAMKKFSAGGAQGRYDRRMADIDKDFTKDSKGKSGRALEVLEAKRAQRTADAKDDLAKRTGADRTATRAAERAAESNLTKTRKYGAAKSVTAEAPAATTKITDSLPTPKMDSSIGASKPKAKASVRRPTAPPRTNKDAAPPASDTKTSAPKTNFRNVRGGSNSGSPTKPLPVTPFNRQAFVDLKVAAERGKPVNSQNPKLARMRAIAEAPGASRAAVQDYRRAVESGMYKAKGGKVKKEKTMKYAKGGSTPPQPTPAERAAGAKFRESIKNIKPTPAQGKILEKTGKKLAKGGSASCGMAKGGKAATKFGAAMKKKSADTKGRAMMKFAKGGSIDGCAVKGKTKTSMVKMKKGGSC